jgi:hypothetical protein
MPDDLTEAMREALERVPDEWAYVDFPTAEDRWYAVKMRDLGLIERTLSGASTFWETRRTEAGRSILAKGLGNG